MKRPVKMALIIAIAVIVAAYAAFNAMQPLKAELIEVNPQTVSLDFKEEGIVEAALDRPVYSMVSGEITNLAVQEGQRVSKGALLVQINTKDMQYQLAQLKAQRKSLEGQEEKTFQEIEQQLEGQKLALEETQRQLDRSREDYQRTKTLFESGAVPEVELEAAENAVKRLENELLQQRSKLQLLMEQVAPMGAGTSGEIPAQNRIGNTPAKQYFQGMIEAVDAQIKQLEYQIGNSRITAPVDGIVQEVDVKPGMVVSPQMRLMKIVGTGRYEINTYLLAEDVLHVREGMKVTLIQKRKDGDYRFYGIVKSIAPSAVEKVSALGLIERRVKVTVQPEGNMPELRPGYSVDVEFRVLEQKDKMAVPKTCLFPYEGGDALWVVRDGRARVQKVTKGMETQELVVIEQGLKPGDKVIKNPRLEGLKEGKKVRG
ncbi:efflux RND transporter periplasmic adaptor subunit [Thermoanaerobacterium sp. DL9XJH110]|uniref:efflux RND transporter periplasmic adaptor subunit n=1 Tax=Thermoanaerobacterium sp. DL9XJH110 TaxID=3386643 RepID=UPI003BB4D7BF